ncbi:DUF4365 domain-containing protein [Desulfovibrio sulfodismutans]|uniref:DUF4365 domain-containing protein n=1 Tax=Desulfolutivibrio sulfodismutans TaxID=63561 RepID=A0A7K3NNZ1_9BACT|nr:DUF4365 domain-containing protein [Desulfolutivibrio sulfodismutans]NDY57906.1 DUF4365 domain-containing protein [Desulfolutivibrio sulfodismutans]QLA11381.1 DUF4365 domain-containing protein [Desulfolutivibrio sulfodismutans DSM 3696]
MSEYKTSNRVKERIGVNAVSRIVEGDWESGWQAYDSQNDDAIDGIILMRRGSKRPTDTGGVVFVQVKCGGDGYRKDQNQYPDHIGVQLDKNYIDTHRPRWASVPGPAVLIFVDDKINRRDPPAWWTNLRDAASYSSTNGGMILVPKSQRFAHHSKSDFHKLCGPVSADRRLEEIMLLRKDLVLPKLGKNESLRNDAWNFYKRWRSDTDQCSNPTLGKIFVNRVGWKHMTRRSRLPERIVQSWLLLGAAKAMVYKCSQVFNLGHAHHQLFPDGNTIVVDYIGLRANVSFPHRHQSVLQVILRRNRLICPYSVSQKIWFYSVYEMRRGMGLD